MQAVKQKLIFYKNFATFSKLHFKSANTFGPILLTLLFTILLLTNESRGSFSEAMISNYPCYLKVPEYRLAYCTL